MPPKTVFTKENAAANGRRGYEAMRRVQEARKKSGHVDEQLALLDDLRLLKPDAVKILRSGMKSRDAKIKHDSARLVLTWLEKLDPSATDEPTKIVYMTAALPHELFEQDPDEIAAFVPGAYLPA